MVPWLEGVNGRKGRVAALAICLAATVLGLACDEAKADRLYRDAAARVERGDLAGAVERLDKIVSEHPQTRAAEKARSDVILYRGLLEASRRFPVRRAADTVVQVARALERYRHDRGGAPASIAGLVPEYLDREPEDPWGRKLPYRVTPGGGYVLSCLGEDGAEGGEAAAADIVVQDGRFVRGGEEAGR